jgi:biopolymer transport protein ExbB
MTRVRASSRLSLALAAFAMAAAPLSAQAWWNADFKQRTVITLNTGAAGVSTSEAISGAAVPLRLHSGNFDFVGAKPDGTDLRVVAGDDKTPLKFSIERFDGTGEMAVLWVQLPTVAAGSDKNLVYVYAGNPKAAAEPAAPVVDSGAALTLRFADSNGTLSDAGGSPLTASGPMTAEANGLIGPSARFDGSQMLELPAADRLKAGPGAPYSVSLWAKPTALAGTLFAQGPLSLALDAGKVVLRLGALKVEGGELPASAWVQIALTQANGKITLYVNGAQAAQAALPAPAPVIDGPIRIAQGYSGLIDELQVAPVMRSADWFKFSRAAQGADAKLVAAQLQHDSDATEGEGGHNYFGILFKNLTSDAWAVIILCGLLFVVAVIVMVSKTLLVRRIDAGNNAFLAAFRAAPQVLKVAGAQQHPGSSLARLYDQGVRQLATRQIGEPGVPPVSGATINAVTAAVNADLVRENQRLNSAMVWLTIAISGGPFLGLLGTVVGVMITFAAIAAAGDVNVNAIAPGIAAALLATVAGLGVAIPALFGYNYLASRIKNISSDMAIFVDEFTTRVAEQFGDSARTAGDSSRH